MASTGQFIASYQNFGLDIENGDGTTLQTLFTPGASGSEIYHINIVSDEPSSAKIVDIYLNDGATDFLWGSINVPANSGTDGSTVAVSGLNDTQNPALDAEPARVLPVENGWTVKAAVQAAVTASQKITITGAAGDF